MVCVALAGGLVVGFALGLFTFKVKSRWCRQCGRKLECIECRPPNRSSVWGRMS